MLTETDDYAKLCREFRWEVPARFNIAAALSIGKKNRKTVHEAQLKCNCSACVASILAALR